MKHTSPIAAIDVDAPELRALAQLAGVAPSRIAAAFDTPAHFFEHLNLEELERITGACNRWMTLGNELAARLDLVAAALRKGSTHAK